MATNVQGAGPSHGAAVPNPTRSTPMTSHELAALLLSVPDLPVAIHANNHTYASGADTGSHGPLRVGILSHYGGTHIIVGNFHDLRINPPNWYVTRVLGE